MFHDPAILYAHTPVGWHFSGKHALVVAIPVALEPLIRIVLELLCEEVGKLRITGKDLILARRGAM
ncbi:MAG: hypothetical protein ACR2HJ_13055 [Fimbriimonadales bacterium]